VASFSKIRFFFITVTLLFVLNSCNKKNDVIPDVIIDFTLDIYDPQFVNLTAMGGSVIINPYTNNWPYASGYGMNGLIIYCGVDEYLAYDRTCPHDYKVNGLSVKVNIDPANSTIAICPKCETTYSLSANGTPASGIGRYPLKNYRTSFDGRFVRVWNN
jgi:hypothetical protein